MWTLLSHKVWIAIVLSAGLAFSHFQAYKSGKATVQKDWDTATTLQAQETVRLVLAAREKEKQLTTKVNNVAQNYETAKKINTALATSLGDRVREFTDELSKRDIADTSTPTINHGSSTERIVLGDCARNLYALGNVSEEHRQQIIALQAYIKSLQ